ncbi:MAG: hypothetical protein LLF94_08225 [Chlamydiales bacterium]|nr:hypothetical protein [Chlamydiales bacterium]
MDFYNFATKNGLLLENIYPSTKIQRCPTKTHPSRKDGFFFWNGLYGFIGDWALGGEIIYFNDKKEWNPEAKEKIKKQWIAAQKERQKKQIEAANKAKDIIRRSTITTHPYLHYKGCTEQTGYVLGDNLYVPMQSVNGAIMGAQAIYLENNTWVKKMIPGMKAKGAMFILGNSQESILCEGYATALTIFKALKRLYLNTQVVCCFSARNILTVSEIIVGRKMIFADNDKSGTGQRVAKESNLPWIMADQEGWDANDIMVKKGLSYVQTKIRELRQI